MALSILPENELINFKETLKWIKEPTHSNNQLKSLFAFMTVTNTNQYYWFVSCTILKRKADTKIRVPYMIFLLAYANYSFQIYLPFCEEDIKHFGQNFQFVSFPWPVETDEESKIVIRKTLNGCSPVKGEDENIFMTFE